MVIQTRNLTYQVWQVYMVCHKLHFLFPPFCLSSDVMSPLRPLRLALAVALVAAAAVQGEGDVTTPATPPSADLADTDGADGDGWPASAAEPALPPSDRPPQSYFERLPLEGRPFGQLDGFSARQGPPLRTCHRPAVCQPLRHGHGYGATCLGTPLRFASTSLNLTDFSSQESLKVCSGSRKYERIGDSACERLCLCLKALSGHCRPILHQYGVKRTTMIQGSANCYVVLVWRA